MTITMRQQSFSDARAKVRVEAVAHLFNLTARTMTENCNKKWNGYRVYAVDGSKIALPTDKKLLKFYGALGKGKTAPTAQGPILYDVLNGIVADAAIAPLSACERTLAKSHLDACVKLDPHGNVEKRLKQL